jgi:hypothetical protein
MTCGPCRELEKDFGVGLESLTECLSVGNDHSREPWQTKMEEQCRLILFQKPLDCASLRELKCGGRDSLEDDRSSIPGDPENFSSISGIPKVHNYYSSSRSGLVSHRAFLASASRLLPKTTFCWPIRIDAFGLLALDIAQRGNQVLRITKITRRTR